MQLASPARIQSAFHFAEDVDRRQQCSSRDEDIANRTQLPAVHRRFVEFYAMGRAVALLAGDLHPGEADGQDLRRLLRNEKPRSVETIFSAFAAALAMT